MADNAQKTPFARSMQRFVGNVARSATRILGQSVPATISEIAGPIVNVNYEVTTAHLPGKVQMPVVGSRYWRPPYQQGEMGFTVSADYYLGGMSGLGGGVADLSQRANLATQAWLPIGNTSWPSVDPNQATLTGGPDGVLLRDSESPTSFIEITNSSITFSVSGIQIVMNASGIFIDGILWETHQHTDTEPGGGLSGPPNP